MTPAACLHTCYDNSSYTNLQDWVWHVDCPKENILIFLSIFQHISLATSLFHQMFIFIEDVTGWPLLQLLLRPSWMSRLVVWWIDVVDVSEECAACVFRAEGSLMSKMDKAGSSKVLVPIYHIHGIASQKTTAVRNSNVTKHFCSANQD
jgi:hypothetical protein